MLTDAQAGRLEAILEGKGFEKREVPYARFSFAGPSLLVTVYEKKNKLLLQGKGTDDFIEFTLEPQVTGILSLPEGAEEEDGKTGAHFGIDESGKGDYFGPLVVAGVYVDGSIGAALRKLGVCDSKLVSSSARIRSLAEGIRRVPGIRFHLVSIGPERYNQLYAEFKNLNRFLAWGHATVIEGLAAKVPACPMALSDQFANPFVLKRALAAKKLSIRLEQRVRAESDVAVAAASILARERFVNWMDAAGEAAGMKLPLGASSQVVKAGRQLVALHGEEMLPKVAKMHFKTTQNVLK
ncbi:ribonuclease HIII [Akkermansia sp.]|uniref:ribonuclease HIII n=1 Tax=Akkermansia sp. TaxID=1872421 RepID=UPI0025B92D92|nr:ribonuclease HIII [Akkermansia sp.]MCC8148419.1 ribonuclease HIII [Akkermansia sp.]